jgi:hypothetical protein
MRTKTLLLAAVLGAAGVATSFAQAVYSVNVVGYANVTVPPGPGYSIIANPLNFAGNDSSNKVSSVINGAPAGFTLYKFDPATGYLINSFSAPPGGGAPVWDDPDQLLKPGEAAFAFNPTGAALTLTFVGEVKQGTALTTPLAAGLNLVSSQVPQRGAVQALLGFPAADGDFIYRFSTNNPPWLIYSYAAPPAGGAPVWDEEPIIEVGEGFFARKVAAGSWVRNFSVQ